MATVRQRATIVGLIALATAVVAVAALWPRRPSRPPPAAHDDHEHHADEYIPPALPPADENWAGSQVCARCHREIWESYQSHPMSQSVFALDQAPVIEDYERETSFSAPESRTYRVERTGDRVVHHEVMTDADDKVLYDQAVDVHYTIGSGKRSRTYVADRGGLLFISPIAWYTSPQRWDLSPGYTPKQHPRFERRAVDGCVGCHAGRVSFDRDKPNRYGNPPFLEATIGCERCHGPAGDHVAWHEGAGAREGDDPIVNPAHLEPGAREDVCNQCHLQGRRVVRQGLSAFDFRPGKRIDDVWVVFVKGAGVADDDTTRAVGQVDQMHESVCFQQSGGRMGCVSCHDPHAYPAADQRVAFYDNRCLKCHDQKGCSLPASERQAEPAAGSCIACHMRPLTASDVPHTSLTDHRILRRPGPARPAAEADEKLALFNADDSRVPAIELTRAMAIILGMRIPQSRERELSEQVEQALRYVLEHNPDDIESLRMLGSVSMWLDRPRDARQFWRAALDRRPEEEGVLQQLGQLAAEQGRTSDALELLEQFHRFNPWTAESYGRVARLQWQAGDPDAALAAAQRALELNPTLIPLRQWLVRAYRELNREADADAEEAFIERMRGR